MISEEKYLKRVVLSGDVYAICLQHALTTEKEEIMGLLIGEVDNENCISYILACDILHRSDKQPDRVEISPEQLCKTAQYADELQNKLKKPMRVLGWYHSHPHITVLPSHVDLRTQSVYQTMDPMFVGLIFSVYQNDSASNAIANNVQVTCFQAQKNSSYEFQRREIELAIEDCPMRSYNLERLANLPKILFQEEAESHGGGSSSDENGIESGDTSSDNIQDENDEISLERLHNDAFKTVALTHIVSKVAKPLYEDLEARLRSVNVRIGELEKFKKELAAALGEQ